MWLEPKIHGMYFALYNGVKVEELSNKSTECPSIMKDQPSTIFYADEIIASLLEMTVIWNIFIKWLKCAYYVWKHDIKILANEGGLFDVYVLADFIMHSFICNIIVYFLFYFFSTFIVE